MEHNEQDSVQQDVEFQATGGKICSCCKRMFPASEIYFNRSKIESDGIRNSCKVCTRGKDSSVIRKIEGMVYCRECKVHLPKSREFFHSKELSDSCFFGICIKCSSVYHSEYYNDNKGRITSSVSANYQKNSETIKARNKVWYSRNKREILRKSKIYKEINIDRCRIWRSNWKRKNKHYGVIYASKRRCAMLNAIPAWGKFEKREIYELYKEASILGMSVDHIVPILSDIVCGLHCIDNLRIITKEENSAKGNRWWPDMP